MQLVAETGMAARQDGLEIVVLRHDGEFWVVVPAKTKGILPATKGSQLRYPIRLGKYGIHKFMRTILAKSGFRLESVERRATEITVLKDPT